MLHTSDWHVGRTFHGQRSARGPGAGAVRAGRRGRASARVDVVLMAGDIYDRAVPSAECGAGGDPGAATDPAGRRGDRRDLGQPRLGAPRSEPSAASWQAGGLHLRTATDAIAAPGPAGMTTPDPLAVYGIPYLEPEIVRHRLGVDRSGLAPGGAGGGDGPDQGRPGRPAGGSRSVVLAHAFVVGAVPGGSERSIAVGGVESVTGEIFDGVDYVALGHLHNHTGAVDRMRYCGSPLPYSFTEAGREKGRLAGRPRRRRDPQTVWRWSCPSFARWPPSGGCWPRC